MMATAAERLMMMVMKSFAWVVSKQAGHCLQGMKGRRCAGARSIFATSERGSWSGLTEKLSLLRLSLTALSPLEKSIFKLEALCNLLWRSAWSTFDHPYRILRLSTPVHSIFHRVFFNFKSIYRNEIVDTLLFILPPPCFAWQWTSPVGKVCCSCCCCCCCLPSFSLSLVQMWGGALTRCGGYNIVSVEFGVIVAWCVWVEIGLKGLERFPLVLVVILATEKDVGDNDWWWWWWRWWWWWWWWWWWRWRNGWW